MDIVDFKSGAPEDRYQYKAFLPERICHQWIIADPELSELLGRADRALGELNAFAQWIPDIEFFIRMYVAKEATHSSRIEGTQTNIEGPFKDAADLNPEERDDWAEVRPCHTTGDRTAGGWFLHHPLAAAAGFLDVGDLDHLHLGGNHIEQFADIFARHAQIATTVGAACTGVQLRDVRAGSYPRHANASARTDHAASTARISADNVAGSIVLSKCKLRPSRLRNSTATGGGS